MPKLVEVPELGQLSFPDDATSEQIEDSVNSSLAERHQGKPLPDTMTADPIGEAVHSANPIVKAWDAVNTPLDKYLPNVVKQGLELSPAGEILNRYGGNAGKGVSEGIDQLSSGMTSSLGIATLGIGLLPRAAQRVIALAFAAQAAQQTPELARQLGDEFGKPEEQRDGKKIANLITQMGANGVMASVAGAHGLKPSETPANPQVNSSPTTVESSTAAAPEQSVTPPEEAGSSSVAAAPAAPAEPLPAPYQAPELGMDEVNARLDEIKRLRESGAFSGVTRQEARLLKRKQELEAQAPPEQAPPEELNPEAKALLETHKDAAGDAAIVTDDQIDKEKSSDVPFAKGRTELADRDGWIAQADRDNNRIIISRSGLNKWLESMPPERRAGAMRSMLSEERIHLATGDTDAQNYWNSLSGFEKWATKYKYNSGSEQPEINYAHEAIRYRMQQLMHMTPTEIAQEYGGQGATLRRLSIQGVDVLEAAVRHIRHGLKGATAEQSAILGRVEDNLKVARQAASGAVVQTQDAPYSQQASDEADQLKAQADHYRSLGMDDEAKEMGEMAQKMTGWAGDKVMPQAAGRPKRDRINPWAKENLFAPSAFAAGGDLEQAGGHALPPGQEVKLPTASEIEGGANKFLDKTISESVGNLEAGKQFRVPDFKDFSAFMKRNYKTQPGQVKDLFQRGLVSRLQSASGETLSAMLKSVFGRDSILARMRVPDAEEGAASKQKTFHQMFLDTTGAILDKARNPGESKGISEAELRQQTRSKAIGMIAKKLMAPMMESDAGVIDRKDVSPSEIRFSGGGEGESSSYQELSKQDEHNPNLGEMLTDRNRRSNSDKASITRRLTVIRDRKTGQIHMVSTWKNPATGRVFLTNPSLPRGEGLRLEEALPRYSLMRSVLLDEPVEKYHKGFADANDYERKFGKEAAENHSNQASYDPEAIPVHEYEAGVEGSPEVESSSFQGPERKMVEAATGAGRSSMEDSMRGRITRPEADAVSRAIGEAQSPEDVRDVLRGLGKDAYDKLKFEFHRATARLGKANEKLARAKAARLEPTESTPEEQAERVAKAQEEVLKAQEESLKASQNFRQNAALRSGVTKIAKRFQNMFGKKRETTNEGVDIRVNSTGEEMLGQMAKSLWSAHLSALSGRSPAEAIMELGGDKKKTEFDKTVTPTGKDLSMRTPPSSRQFQERPFSNVAKTQPQELSPAPLKPVETLEGGELMQISQSLSTPEQRQSGFNYKFTPEEEREIELESAINQVRHEIYKREGDKEEEQQRAAAELKKSKFSLEGEAAPRAPASSVPDPRVKVYPPRPTQPKLFAAGRRKDWQDWKATAGSERLEKHIADLPNLISKPDWDRVKKAVQDWSDKAYPKEKRLSDHDVVMHLDNMALSSGHEMGWGAGDYNHAQQAIMGSHYPINHGAIENYFDQMTGTRYGRRAIIDHAIKYAQSDEQLDALNRYKKETYPEEHTIVPTHRQPNLFAAGRVTGAVKEQAERLAGLGSAWNKRGDIHKWIAAGYDSFLTVAHNVARVIGNEIRTEATNKGRVNQEMLGGAIAMRSANPFRKIFNYSMEAIEAFDKEAAVHPDMELSRELLSRDAHGIKLYLQDLIEKTDDKSKQNYYHKLIGDINAATGPDKPIRNEKGQTIRWRGQPETVPSSVRMEGLRVGKQAERLIENKLVEDGMLNHKDVKYEFDPSYKYKLDTFLQQIKIGQAKALEMLKSGNVFVKRQARAWMKDLASHQKDVEYAKAHWDDHQLRDTTLKSVAELDHQYDAERAAGTSLSYDDAYLPGRYSGQFHNNLSVVFGPVEILGRQFAAGKSFDTPYDATSTGPYIAATHDISNLVEHRIRQGSAKIGQKAWEEQLATIKDPATKQQAFATAKYVDGHWMPELPVGADGANYKAISANASRAPVYALKGSYSRLLSSLVSPSKVDDWAVARGALQAGQFLKHTALLGDFFHLSRITHYAASIFGKGAYKFGSAHTPGWAALDFREEGVDKAVERGVLTQKDADWLREKLPVKENGFKTTASRLEIAKKFEKTGFNVGQIGDAIYKDLVAHIPVLGKYNKFLFDKYTRGLMMRSAIEEYSRLQAKNPEAESSTLMRGISRDLNNYFGSIGKQGWIKSSTFQDLSRLLFLAPQWVEGIAKKDAAIPYKLAMAAKEGGLGGVADVLKGNETIARGVTRGLVTMFVLSQVVNMITRRQPTWDNEEGHKFDADIGNRTFINPLSVFNEMLHEFIHYNETKPTAWEAIRQIGENKLGFFGRAGLVLATGKSPTGEVQTSSMGALKTAAMQLMPVPITGQPITQALTSAASGGRMADPVQPEQLTKATASLLGVKADIAPKVDFALHQKAAAFVKANKLKNDPTAPEMTDQPSYSKLRHALTLGNTGGASQILEDLRGKGVKDEQLISAMKTWVKAPFTGSRRNDLLWLHSMTDNERAKYHEAIKARYDTYRQFVDFYINHAK